MQNYKPRIQIIMSKFQKYEYQRLLLFVFLICMFFVCVFDLFIKDFSVLFSC